MSEPAAPPPELVCLTCDRPLVPGRVEASYLGQTFPVDLPRCPSCGFVYVSEELAGGKMLMRYDFEDGSTAETVATCATNVDGLARAGYQFIKPQGAFYLFVKSPIPDDVEFVGMLLKHNILVVPGSGFGCPGYFRIAFCVDDTTIIKSIRGFEATIQHQIEEAADQDDIHHENPSADQECQALVFFEGSILGPGETRKITHR